MTELLRTLPQKENYTISIDSSRNSMIKIFAPHGGCIEPATEPIALGVAIESYDYFVFSGKRKEQCNRYLHVTSTRYDEPRCLRMAEEAEMAVAFHGSDYSEEVIHVGGGNKNLVLNLIHHLRHVSYPSEPAPPGMKGEGAENFINRAKQKGIQIELSSGFRKRLYPVFPRSIQRDEVEFQRFIESMKLWMKEIELQLTSGDAS